MKLLLQRVTRASVDVDGVTVGAINRGLLVFVGLEKTDDAECLARAAQRLLSYRVFADDTGRMNCDVTQVPEAAVLLVSQFTLAADTRKGRRPSFSSAMAPDQAEQQFNAFVQLVREGFSGAVETGEFGADMQVSLVNDGPVTFLLES